MEPERMLPVELERKLPVEPKQRPSLDGDRGEK